MEQVRVHSIDYLLVCLTLLLGAGVFELEVVLCGLTEPQEVLVSAVRKTVKDLWYVSVLCHQIM